MSYRVVPLESLAGKERSSIKIGPFGSQLKKTELVASGIHVLGIENVLNNCFDGLGDRYITNEKFESLKAFEVKAGDILITMMGTIGEIAIVPPGTSKSIMDSHLLRFRPDRDICIPEYVRWLIKSSASTQQNIHGKAHGAIMKGLNSSIIKSIPAPLPPPSEQALIVEILDQADSLVKKRGEAITKAEQILSALFYKMFGDPECAGSNFDKVLFSQAIEDVSSSEPKLQRREYEPFGSFPVVDQGQNLITGYTNDSAYLFGGGLPVIVFGDHTRIFKFIDFPFVRGSDGTRVLAAREGFEPYFLYAHLKLIGIANAGYSRHYKFLKEKKIIKPSLQAQRLFSEIGLSIRSLQQMSRKAEKKTDQLFKSVVHKAFSGSLTTKWRKSHAKQLLVEIKRQEKLLQKVAERN